VNFGLQMGLINAQKTVHCCTVFCALRFWFKVFDGYSRWQNMNANFLLTAMGLPKFYSWICLFDFSLILGYMIWHKLASG
jgi:hypothetical protein